MAIELIFTKSDNEAWGFRLAGGAECDVPLTVIKVAEDSIAEKGGLKINDVIVRVNETSTVGLTHPEVHDLLVSAGNHLVLTVRRDLPDLLSPLTYDDENNEEITNIMQGSIENEENFDLERQVDFEIVDPSSGVQKSEVISEKQIKEQSDPFPDVTNRKWSTFLQKPINQKPVLRKQEEGPKAESYRVVITKQNKKTEQIMESVDEVTEEIDKASEETEEMTQEPNVPVVQEVSIRAEITEEGEVQIEENNENIEAESNQIPSEKNAELEKLLEEKLAEVQKQLQALAQLPSTIQSTIDAVTKQLATIVHITTSSVAESEDKVMSEVNSESENDMADQAITEESNEEIEDVEDSEVKEEVGDEVEDARIEQDVEKEEIVADTDEGLTEEEKEAKRLEQEFLEKQQKEREIFEEFKQRRLKQKPTLPLKPIERPIILPGGRRWSNPDDACPSRHPKMTDEKIANTIETYSEVIAGKLKGINFLKYQPPPKNLDYLQRSDVYKLVHDLEPAVRGISSRASKIIAEQDYYQAG